MNKQDFLSKLCQKLSPLSRKEREERILFYGEMLDDRIEDGMTPEQAVASIGTPEEIAARILHDCPPKRRANLRPWIIVMLAVGAPLWLVLFLAAAIVALALGILLWVVVAVCWVVFAALLLSAFAAVNAGIGMAIFGRFPTGVVMVGAGLICAGVAILVFYLCKLFTKGACRLSVMPFRRKRRGCDR